MLRGIDRRIQPDLLRALMAMGHGDELVISDANFPSETVGRKTVTGSVLHFGGGALEALEAILALLPLDAFEPAAVRTMEVVGDPKAMPAIVETSLPLLRSHGQEPHFVERFAFYEHAACAFAVVRTLETRPYGNFILRKGVIAHAD